MSEVELDVSTLSLLDQVLAEKAADQAKLRSLMAAGHRSDSSDDYSDADTSDDDALLTEAEALADLERLNGIATSYAPPKPRSKGPLKLTVDEFRSTFGESWQLSQFWYTDAFVTNLFDHLQPHMGSEDQIAFMCSPTAYVGFQHRVEQQRSYLLEYDDRFQLLSSKDFVRYDLNKPLAVPQQLKGQMDMCIIDPPFLNRETNDNLAKTARALLKPGGKVVLITGCSIADEACPLYAPEMQLQDVTVEHHGLANDFGVWSNL